MMDITKYKDSKKYSITKWGRYMARRVDLKKLIIKIAEIQTVIRTAITMIRIAITIIRTAITMIVIMTRK